MTKTIQSTAKLSNSVEIPYLGLGVYQSPPGKETQNAVRYALDAGYRHIDTARIYSNERDVGEVLKKMDIPRKDIFVTTKLWNSDHGFESTISACQISLSNLGLEYLDLYLIHWPGSVFTLIDFVSTLDNFHQA